MVPIIQPDMKNIDSSFIEESNDYSDTETNYFFGHNTVFGGQVCQLTGMCYSLSVYLATWTTNVSARPLLTCSEDENSYVC